MTLLWLLACKGGGDESAAPVDTQPEGITYPTQERVLIYDGHGGEPGDSVGTGGTRLFEAFVASEYGWQVDRRNSLGEPEKFRLILLMDPGIKDPVGWSDDNVEGLKAAMKTGTRIGIVTSPGNCGGPTINPLLEKLGLDMRLAGTNNPAAIIADGFAGTQMSVGVEEVYLSSPCLIQPNGAEVFLYQERDSYAAVERPLWAGDVVLVGDYGWMDDTDQLDLGDNRNMVKRLVEVDPSLAAR